MWILFFIDVDVYKHVFFSASVFLCPRIPAGVTLYGGVYHPRQRAGRCDGPASARFAADPGGGKRHLCVVFSFFISSNAPLQDSMWPTVMYGQRDLETPDPPNKAAKRNKKM